MPASQAGQISLTRPLSHVPTGTCVFECHFGFHNNSPLFAANLLSAPHNVKKQREGLKRRTEPSALVSLGMLQHYMSFIDEGYQ